jgi:hypothetical protein
VWALTLFEAPKNFPQANYAIEPISTPRAAERARTNCGPDQPL